MRHARTLWSDAEINTALSVIRVREEQVLVGCEATL